MQFTLIPAGEFIMGHMCRRKREKPVHVVTVTKPFYLGVHQVTNTYWQAVMGIKRASRKKGNRPVTAVSWNDTKEFLQALNKKEGCATTYRLPTEAEWEYACRAGTTTEYSFGDDVGELSEYAWYKENSDCRVHPVGQKKPNQWGLYDMHGNVWEWVEDWYDVNYYSVSRKRDPPGTRTGKKRVLRGGSFSTKGTGCRCSYRFPAFDKSTHYDQGFRLVANLSS